MTDRSNSRRRGAVATTSWMALSLVLAFGPSQVAAQSTTQTAPATSGSAVEDDETPKEVIVVGSRASQQSANQRKKDARTATDSIVADDIGSFPDRNVNEAISRVPGVALQRNEYGEGSEISIRGNGPDLTRVELDGLGVQSTGTAGRGADLRELPAELIKSVDVVKGSTADMTEGGLGGTVQIKTRTGLDFAKPYFSLRTGVQANSLGRKWTPDFNGVASRKFLDGRVGVIVSGNYQKIQNNGHNYETTTSGRNGYSRLFDFDNSPEKTFSYNPATVGTDAADIPFANSTAPDGTSLTPRELVELAASAKSKAECLTLFPSLPAPTTNQTSNTAIATRTQRVTEQQTCLNQWNDYTPSLIRHFTNAQTEQRYGFDGRVDFKASRNLTIFAKGTVANRKVHDQFRSRTPVTLFNINPAGSFDDRLNGNTVIRTVSPNAPAGYYLIDGVTSSYAALGSPAITATRTAFGQVVNVDPASVKVDANHNVTEMTVTNNSVNIDQIENTINAKTKYFQSGLEWRSKRVDIDLWGGYTRADSSRGDQRTNRSYTYGTSTLKLQSNGLWDIQLPAGYDETNPANFVQLRPAPCVSGGSNPATCIGQNAVIAGPNAPASPAYLVSQMPLTTPSFQVSYSPFIGITSEKSAKADVTFRTTGLIPFITRMKVGGQYRNNINKRWFGGGYTAAPAVGTFGQPGYVPAIIVPTANVRGSFRACEPTSGSSAAGGLSCNYGFVPFTNPLNIRSGVDTLTPADLQALFERTLEPADSVFFGTLPNRGNLPPSWQGIRTDELFAALGASQFINNDCVITCVANDGKTYDQPVTLADETIKNVYATFDFNARLPLGMRFDGNFGVRGVFTNRKASALQTLRVIRTTATFDPANPNNASGFFTQDFTGNSTLNAKTTDWLPSLNMNFWGFNDSVVLRLYGGKTVAQPPIDRVIPGGTCTVFDERNPVDEDFDCTGRVGNPGLKPFTAWNYNASLEWYPNKDTQLSVTYGTLDVKIGTPIAFGLTDRPFAGSTEVDPLTGRPLSELIFTYPSWINGPGYKRSIIEAQAKTAFTFLPWFLRYTGADVNVSILSSVTTVGQFDPLSGDIMNPPNESKYYINASLWYDDGKFNMRVAYQKRATRFNCITPCGGANGSPDQNYPGEQWSNVRFQAPGWSPGIPQFIDGTTFIDAKMSYNLNSNAQIYVEGRNLTRESQTLSAGKYTPFADGTPKVMKLSYGGFRVLMGASLRFGNPRGRR